MESLGTYKPEFDRVIGIYAQLYIEYIVIGDTWRRTGYKVIENYTNKGGNTNKQQSPIYKALQKVREDMHYYETCLGLTPASLKKINDKAIDKKESGKLEELLRAIEKENGI